MTFFMKVSEYSSLEIISIFISLWAISLCLRIIYYTTMHLWSNTIVEGKKPIQKELEIESNNLKKEFFQYVFVSRNMWICGKLKNIQTTLVILPKNIIRSISGMVNSLVFSNRHCKNLLQNSKEIQGH